MKKLLLATSLISTMISVNALADNEKRIIESLTLTANQSVDIKFPVGSIEIEIVDSNQLEIEIEVKPKNTGWTNWFSSNPKLSDLKLDKKISNHTVSLALDHENLDQVWHVKVPRSAALDIDLGVGDVDIDNLVNSAEVDVGVGSVSIDTDSNSYQQIMLEAGVGDTRISGFSDSANNQRQMVSSSSEYTSNGDYRINVEVGVGDVKVRY
jgi:hypothetical protein